MKKLCYFLLFPFLFSACSTGSKVSEGKSSTYEVINLGPDFEHFWEQAKDKKIEEQIAIWDQTIEKPHQAFYDGMVWQKNENPKWEERKLRRLKEFLPKYNLLYPDMMAQFNQFDATLRKQIKKFSEFFSDARFALPIYAAPTATFNGKGGEGGESGDPLGRTVLAFGIDMIVDRKDNPDVLYAHELFHIYHVDAIGVNEHVFLSEGHLTLPLWLEGLATYVSQQMNPNASMSDILMDKELPKLSDQQIQLLAQMFLKQANEKAFDSKKPEIYKRWFAIDPQYNLGSQFPPRCGYLLGLKVAQHLAKSHSLNEMVHWKVKEAHENALTVLNEITGL